MKKIRTLIITLLAICMVFTAGCNFNGATPSGPVGSPPPFSVTSKAQLDELLKFNDEDVLNIISLYSNEWNGAPYIENRMVWETEFTDQYGLVKDDNAIYDVDGLEDDQETDQTNALKIKIASNRRDENNNIIFDGVSIDVSACNLKLSEIDHIYISYRTIEGSYDDNMWVRFTVNQNSARGRDKNTIGTFKLTPRDNYSTDQQYSLITADEIYSSCWQGTAGKAPSYDDYFETLNFHFYDHGKHGEFWIDYIKIVSKYETNSN